MNRIIPGTGQRCGSLPLTAPYGPRVRSGIGSAWEAAKALFSQLLQRLRAELGGLGTWVPGRFDKTGTVISKSDDYLIECQSVRF